MGNYEQEEGGWCSGEVREGYRVTGVECNQSLGKKECRLPIRGTLVLLQNLDPAYTSAEVGGQAFVIFKTRDAAVSAIRKLEEGCLLLSNGRPLVGSFGTPCFPGKQSTFVGHLSIDKVKVQMQREMKQAVSTSHCSQPNTIEYEMAMDWCLQQERSDSCWKKLYKRQGDELRKLKASLKSK
ncbi:Protein anti-silencing 1 [Vitis vinifera]|uniref:Protein anti-silencing 1 n=1 Tax=Vitis vinifera TaxID=29760 RepID=A0A438FXE9_VITVI|nr:Protein anti-silencing 1 [Vitis vinifera]